MIGRWGFSAAVVALVLVHLGLVLDGAARHSATWDEVVYPAAGYSYLTKGDYRLNPEHPPLMKLLTGMAWIGTDLDVDGTPGWEEGNQWAFGPAMLYDSGRQPGTLLFRARVPVAILSALLALSICFVARGVAGKIAGLVALTVYVFDPLVVAHAGLATTDLGATAFYFLAAVAMARALGQPDRTRVWVAGGALGLALATKFSMVTLGPALLASAALAWILARREGDRRWAKGIVLATFGIVAVAIVVLLLTYRITEVHSYFTGLDMLRGHAEVGRQSFLLGRYGSQGWWWYFPAAWAIKTPIPLIVLSLAGVGALIVQGRRSPVSMATLLIAVAAYVAAAMSTSINLGLRHLMPVVPFLAVGTGIAAAELKRRGRFILVGVAALLLWLAVGTLRVHPEEIAFSHELAGGPERTWRHLADSNVDWGQSLPALHEEVSRHPLRRLYLGYFGTADPAAHGLSRYHSIPAFSQAPRRHLDGQDPGGKEWIAISVTNLLEVYGRQPTDYAWLRERSMTAFPGYSIALYDISGDAGAHRQLGATALAYGDPEAAAVALARAVELDPSDPTAWADLAVARLSRGLVEQALRPCRQALAMGHGDPALAELCERALAGSLEASPPDR